MRHDEALARLPELVGLREAAADDAELSGHVAGCARCRTRLEHLRAIDERLGELGVPSAPSRRLENRIRAIPGGAGAPERLARPRRWLAVAAACMLLVVVVAAGALLVRDGGGVAEFQATRVVELVSTETGDMNARVEIGAADGGRTPVRIVASGLPHGGDRYYGLWLTGAGGAVSGGSFRPDGEGECVVELQVPSGDWSAVDLTERNRPPSPSTTMAAAPL